MVEELDNRLLVVLSDRAPKSVATDVSESVLFLKGNSSDVDIMGGNFNAKMLRC